ncbi:MAG: ABC-F type ribosomal protection protein [Bacilli bacterium]|nr:ABC-F type ribosomal protection protein [Bacilli bacterium]
MSLINVNNLTFCYPGSFDNIFENISFQIDTDWKLGFVGRNGRGKTTFLNLLMEKYEHSGTIDKTVEFEYFPFNIKDFRKKTIDIINDINREYDFWELKREISKIRINEECLYRSYNTLSKGEQTKILLVALFLKKNSFLLIDEPTNHLDLETRMIVAKYLNSKTGFILVSHDARFLDNTIDHIIAINKNNIEIQKGNFSSWYYNKKIQDEYEISENDKLKKDIKRLNKAKLETAKWSAAVEKTKNGIRVSGIKPDKGRIGHKAAKMMKRSKNIESLQTKAIEDKNKLLKNIERSDSLKISPLQYYTSNLVYLNNVSIYYNNRLVCDNINFMINEGDRIAIKGRNGTGKSSILKLIKGDDIRYNGDFGRGSNLIISYVPQDMSFLKGNLKEYINKNDIDESLFKTILIKLDFTRDQFEKDLKDYSSGQKKKVLIAKSLSEKAHLYIWDEPLNYIDIFSRIQIEKLLLEYKPTIIFVEHDEAFLEKVSTIQINL